jgi:hypothetical protein
MMMHMTVTGKVPTDCAHRAVAGGVTRALATGSFSAVLPVFG